jgi:hypothetical protein
MTINETMECRVLHGDTQYLSIRGEAQATKISLDQAIIDLGIVYVGCPVTHQFTAKNHSYLTTNYFWYTEEEAADNGKGYTLDIDSQSGTMPSSASQPFTITFLPLAVGEYEALLPCFIQEDRENVIGLIVKARVQGLDVSVQVKDATGQVCEENILDFGTVKLFEKNTLTVSMINQSQCATQYMLAFGRFGAPIQHTQRVKSEPLTSTVNSTKSRTRKNERLTSVFRTGHYESMAYQSNKARSIWDEKVDRDKEKDFHKEMLVEGNGIAFDVDLLNGKIDGYETVDIQVMEYSNACGTFQDVLQLEIVGLPTIMIPIRVTVIGTPVMFLPKTLGLRFDRNAMSATDDIAEQSWPLIPINTNAPAKVVQVKNYSLTDINIEWKPSTENPILIRLSNGEDGITAQFDERESSSLEQPFTIEPKSQVIPANEVRSFSLGFKSNTVQLYNEQIDGFCTIVPGTNPQVAQHLLSITGDVTELLRPLRLALCASTIPTQLSMNHKRVKFIASASDQPGTSFKKSIVLTNNTATPLSFSIQTNPSEIFSIDAKKSSKTLTPQQEMTVEVYFTPPASTGSEAVKQITGELIILFSHGETQTLPIEAELHTSQLVVTPQWLDFGTFKQHTYNPLIFSTLPLYIQNNSRVARGKWKIQSAEDGEKDPSFVVNTTEGTTPYSSNLIEGKSVVYIDFKPKANGKFEHKFDVIGVSDDDRPLDVIGTVLCTGIAQYDEFADTLRVTRQKK